MGRKRQSARLTVALNGRVVGYLERGADGATRFDYVADWLNWRYAIPVSRSMPLLDRPFTGAPVRAVFENLLPDDDRIRTRLAARVDADGTDAFSLLAALGRDCVGALQFLPERVVPAPPSLPEGIPLSMEEIGQRILALRTAPLGLRGGDDAFRISLAGAQDKTALLYHEGQWKEPIGVTPTTHILKPQIGKVLAADGEVDLSQSVQNEHFCMTLCRELGLDVARTDILNLGDDLSVLVVERFDRYFDQAGRLLRLPQEDMCQALGVAPIAKYESDGGPGLVDCLELLKSSDSAQQDRQTFMKAQIAFWMIGATDGHAKNFSLSIRPQGRFSLAPLYDIFSTQWQNDRRQIKRNAFRLAMAVGRARRYKVIDIQPRHFEQTATKAGFAVSALHEVMEELIDLLPTAANISAQKMDATVPEAMVASILTAAAERARGLEAYLADYQ